MKKIFQYIMLAATAFTMAACANDIEDTTATISTDNIKFIVGDFPAFDDSQTRTIGTPDAGKTAWENGDELLISLENSSYKGQYYTLVKTSSGWEISGDQTLRYKKGESPSIMAIYAPNYTFFKGSVILKSGKQDGMSEFISVNCELTGENADCIKIPFNTSTRDYSRLRIATIPNTNITIDVKSFMPISYGPVDYTYSLTSDANGNAYLYGTFYEDGSVTAKYNGATLTSHTFTETTTLGKSYALDATVISTNNVDEIKSAIKQKIASGETNIRLNLASDAGTDMFNAIKSAINEAAPKDQGKFDLTLIGVETIPSLAFFGMKQLKSVRMSDVKEIMASAFRNCTFLTDVEAPSLNKLYPSVFSNCSQISKLVFGPLEYADDGGLRILDSIDTSNIDLILSDDQYEMEFIANNLYIANSSLPYSGSDHHNMKVFLEYTFKSVTCKYTIN